MTLRNDWQEGESFLASDVNAIDEAINAKESRIVVSLIADTTLPSTPGVDVIALAPDGVTVTLPDAATTTDRYTVKSVPTNTVALLHFNGADSSTTIFDSSPLGAGFTVHSGVVIATAQSKFGGSSAYFPNSGSYLTPAGDVSNYAFGTGDFTIEMWAYAASALHSTLNDLYDGRPGVNGPYPHIYVGGDNKVYYNVANTFPISGGNFTLSTWHHVALCRAGGSTRMFLDGTQIGTTYADSNVYASAASRPMIGNDSFSQSFNFVGYIDELRITKNYARYTAAFTPPSTPFGTGPVILATTSSQTIDGLPPPLTIGANTSIDLLPLNRNWVVV